MMYEEFTDRLRELHVPEKEWPSVDEYHSLIERVYNYHPASLFRSASRRPRKCMPVTELVSSTQCGKMQMKSGKWKRICVGCGKSEMQHNGNTTKHVSALPHIGNLQ